MIPTFLTQRPMVFLAGALCGAIGGWFGGMAFFKLPETDAALAAAPSVARAAASPPKAKKAMPDKVKNTFPENPPTQAIGGLVKPVPMPVPVLKSAAGDDEAWQQVFGILSLEDEAQRLVKLKEMLPLITQGNSPFYQNAWKAWSSSQGPVPTLENSLYNRRLGQVIGAQVVGSRTGEGPKDMAGVKSFVRDQFLGWIGADPKAAEQWLDGLKHPEFRAAMEKVWEEAADAAANHRQ